MNHPLEEELWLSHSAILGIDEAGRGPICGPMTVAGVIFPPGYVNERINDSKKLSEKKREELVFEITQDALAYWILFVDEKTIDTLNIYRAAQSAMETIALKAGADLTLTDAMPLRNGIRHEAIVKGDAKSISIAAASILAKVSRDHYMKSLDEQYPQYGLAKHKGYPTRAHLDALERFGLQPFYRTSYSPVAKLIEMNDRLTLF